MRWVRAIHIDVVWFGFLFATLKNVSSLTLFTSRGDLKTGTPNFSIKVMSVGVSCLSGRRYDKDTV